MFLGLEPEDWRAVGLSVYVTTLAVLLSLPPGVALGWLLARRRFPARAAVETAVNLPLVLPPVVIGYLLLLALGRRGWAGVYLAAVGVEVAFTPAAAVLAVAVMGFPLLVRASRLGFEGVEAAAEEAARSLGAGPWQVFWRVTLPLARPGVVAGAVLAFARGLGEFGATLLFAGNSPATRTLALQIFLLRELPGEAAEARLWRLAAGCLALAFAALAASELLERRARRGRATP
jgi:molybdate transport system permease protein